MATHWKSMMDRDFIFAFDLDGRDVTVTISKVTAGQLTGEGGRKSKKPLCYFEGKEKALALNSTNCKVIAALYGNDVEKWVGKRVTLYPTQTEMGGKTVDCIRVRPKMPSGKAPKQPEPTPPAEPYDGPPDDLPLAGDGAREPGVD